MPQPAQPHHLSEAEIEALPTAFPATIVPPRDARFAAIAAGLSRRDTIGRMGKVTSTLIDLSRVKVPLRVEECGNANAFYSRSKQEIRICYEFVELVEKLDGKAPSSIDDDTNFVIAFTALHEMGHALIDLMHIDVRDEEDRADQFAFLVLTNYEDIELGRRVMHAPAAFFVNLDDTEDPNSTGDPHSRSIDRAANAICLLWGRQHDPALGRRLGERAARCDAYTTEVLATWNGWLKPYTRLDTRRTF